MIKLSTSFTSTGEKLFYHQEAMTSLRDKKGVPITAWIASHDVCNHKCAFCSVGERAGDALTFLQIEEFIQQLLPLGLKSVILSGGGNPILYRCKSTGFNFNDLVNYLHKECKLEIGLITNGAPMIEYEPTGYEEIGFTEVRNSWKTVSPETLDMLKWIRISMSGIDSNHKEQEVFVPDIDPLKTTLGFSWIMSDAYEEPSHKHGWVSTPEDIKTEMKDRKIILADERLPFIESEIRHYVEKHNPAYVRLLCNCLQPDLIPKRHAQLTEMAGRINPQICFSQNKPPRQPKGCRKIYPHPCLNADGWCYSCDSVVLNRTAGHKFGSAWRVCKWNEIGELYSKPIRDVVSPGICPGCVFADQVDLIHDISEGAEIPSISSIPPQHVNFV